jgi:hypothetical protein
VRDHAVKGKKATNVTNAADVIETGGFNSGVLGSKQSHIVKLGAVGTYSYSDVANVEMAGAIIVESTGGYRVMLPLVRK